MLLPPSGYSIWDTENLNLVFVVVGPVLTASPRFIYTPAKVSPIFTNDVPNTVTLQCVFDLVDSTFFSAKYSIKTNNKILATRTKSAFTKAADYEERIVENTWNLALTIPSTHKIDFNVTLCDKDSYRCRVTDTSGHPDPSVYQLLLFDGELFPVWFEVYFAVDIVREYFNKD